MSNILSYKNQLWKEEIKYTDVGAHEFTLQPGRYLFLCQGAKGGKGGYENYQNLGGTSIGELTLSQSTTFYAYVGGDGGDCPPVNRNTDVPGGEGGYNGGGVGGTNYRRTGYNNASGGGGASDIRLHQPSDFEGVDTDIQSLNTRIIVAGGGGGVWNVISEQNHIIGYNGMGGGIVGGCTNAVNASDAHSLLYASQTDGYSFGIGQDGVDSSGSSNPSSGAGGGWFGGYASESPGAGGGGSGYVLTSDSYKPSDYMEDYQPYQMTNTLMTSGTAEQSVVCVYVPYKTLHANDVIKFIQTGSKESIQLMPGRYLLKCYGGDGGVVYSPLAVSKGGYSEGILTLTSPETLYVYVAGSGLYSNMISSTYVHQMNPMIGFNGGGQPKAYGTRTDGYPGGGATDIRARYDDLFARIIVAGGSGGQTSNLSVSHGGEGGGETGATGTTSSPVGSHPGPGTQTGSPIEPTCPECNGGFGYGGSTPTMTGTYGGPGAGGSGWYGGSSTYNTNQSAYKFRGGSGGSGYVLTSVSYKPDGYLLNDRFYLSDTSTVQGGSTLPIGISKAEITVLNINLVLMLCRDVYGLKRYDTTQDQWVLLSNTEQSLTEEIFLQYGSTEFVSDNGLANEYEIIVFDPEDLMTSIDLNVTPNKQTVTHEMTTRITINDMKQKLSFDPSVYDVDIVARRQVLKDGTVKITTTFDVDKKQKDDSSAKVFYVTYTDGK